jgi:hypothetical protein
MVTYDCWCLVCVRTQEVRVGVSLFWQAHRWVDKYAYSCFGKWASHRSSHIASLRLVSSKILERYVNRACLIMGRIMLIFLSHARY